MSGPPTPSPQPPPSDLSVAAPSSTQDPSPTSSTYTSTSSNSNPTSSTQAGTKSTSVPDSSTSRGLFGNSAAVAGTFAAVGVVATLIFLVIFLRCRRYRRNKQRQLVTQNTPRMCLGPIPVDPCADPLDFAAAVERQNWWEKHSFYSAMEKHMLGLVEGGSSVQELARRRSDADTDVSRESRQPQHLAETDYHYCDQDLDDPSDFCPSPKFRRPSLGARALNSRPDSSLDDPFDRQVYQPTTKLPRTLPNHPHAVAQSESQLQFSDWQRISQESPSPSIYSVAMPEVEDDISAHPSSTPTSVAPPRTPLVANQDPDFSANVGGQGWYRARINPDAYRIPFDLEDGESSPDTAQESPREGGARRSAPPPIPPKNPLRATMSALSLQNLEGQGE